MVVTHFDLVDVVEKQLYYSQSRDGIWWCGCRPSLFYDDPEYKRHPNNTKTDQLRISEVIIGLPRPYHHIYMWMVWWEQALQIARHTANKWNNNYEVWLLRLTLYNLRHELQRWSLTNIPRKKKTTLEGKRKYKGSLPTAVYRLCTESNSLLRLRWIKFAIILFGFSLFHNYYNSLTVVVFTLIGPLRPYYDPICFFFHIFNKKMSFPQLLPA